MNIGSLNAMIFRVPVHCPHDSELSLDRKILRWAGFSFRPLFAVIQSNRSLVKLNRTPKPSRPPTDAETQPRPRAFHGGEEKRNSPIQGTQERSKRQTQDTHSAERGGKGESGL